MLLNGRALLAVSLSGRVAFGVWRTFGSGVGWRYLASLLMNGRQHHEQLNVRGTEQKRYRVAT